MADNLVYGIYIRAAAYIAKYSEKDEYGSPMRIDVPFLHTSIHSGNRGGVYTQGNACKTLLQNIGTDGFSKDEANSMPIVMRERPLKDRQEIHETFLEYNIRKS